MRATLLQVVDPAPAEEFMPPAEGSRLVSIQFRLENIGSAIYADSPEATFKLIDDRGQQFDTTLDSKAGPGFGGYTTINVGDTRLGFLTYELATASSPSKVQVVLDGPLSPPTGEWSL